MESNKDAEGEEDGGGGGGGGGRGCARPRLLKHWRGATNRVRRALVLGKFGLCLKLISESRGV
jgi:hypothetical protein